MQLWASVSDKFVMNIVTCLFDSGNLEGQSPYMTGASSCFNCPDNKRSCVNNLCSNGEAAKTFCYWHDQASSHPL